MTETKPADEEKAAGDEITWFDKKDAEGIPIPKTKPDTSTDQPSEEIIALDTNEEMDMEEEPAESITPMPEIVDENITWHAPPLSEEEFEEFEALEGSDEEAEDVIKTVAIIEHYEETDEIEGFSDSNATDEFEAEDVVIEIQEDTVEIAEEAIPETMDEAVEEEDFELTPQPEPKEQIQIETAAEEISPFRDAPSNALRVWEAKRKSSLYETVKAWCAEENVKFVWDASESYTLDKDIFINGTFKNALNILFSKGLTNAPQYTLIEDGAYEFSC